MQAPRSPSRTPSFASTTDTTNSQHNAALLGAATAFGRPATKSKAAVNTYSGTNGALAAATTASPSPSPMAGRRPPAPMVMRNSTGESVKSNGGRGAPALGAMPKPKPLGVPQPPQRGHSKSPSLQAAALATARAPHPEPAPINNGQQLQRARTTKRPAAPPKPRRLSEYYTAADDLNVNQPTDATPIPPTTSLVDLFERKASRSQPAGKKPGPLVIRPSNDLAMKSPKPVRTSGGITSLFQLELEDAERSNKPPPVEPDHPSRRGSSLTTMRSSTDSYASASEDLAGEPNALPVQQRTLSSTRQMEKITKDGQPPSLPQRPSTSQSVNIPKQMPGNLIASSEALSPSSASTNSIPAQYHYRYPSHKMTPNMTGDQLANAMVAGSLASSRAPSPHKLEPPPPPTRRHKHMSTLSFSRTPSPPKTGMRHTLRKADDESSEDEDGDSLHPYGKHKKKRLVRKHPNKHHEGDRKRWREAVTERERKRYEGVWAANKGLYVSFTNEERQLFEQTPNSQREKDAKEAAPDQVSNIIVRDIWNRSRLPSAVLEMVWDLVDNEGVGRLGKEEFVVGMWLIDQRLKGRKLPVKVSETVWASVRGLQGIKIRK